MIGKFQRSVIFSLLTSFILIENFTTSTNCRDGRDCTANRIEELNKDTKELKELENKKRISKVEQETRELRSQLENIKQTIIKHELEFQKLKNSVKPIVAYNSGYTVELQGKVEPCLLRSGLPGKVDGVTQLDGRIFFICHGLNYAQVFDAYTLTYLHNISLPVNGEKSFRYLVSNLQQRSLYFLESWKDEFSEFDNMYASATSAWKCTIRDHFRWTPIAIPENFQASLIGSSKDGEMLLANSSQILFYDSLGKISKVLEYKSWTPSSHASRIIQTRRGSLLIPGFKGIAQIDFNGLLVGTFATGMVKPTGDYIGDYISDISEGPEETLILSKKSKDRILLMDIRNNKLSVLIDGNGSEITSPYRISFDPINQLLVVVELWQGSFANSKIYRVRSQI